MTNIIEAQKKVNKKLLEENENLKKQLANKEENFKLRIINAVNNVMENEERSKIVGTLMTLKQHFWSWDEWVKVQKENEVEKVTFSNEFTFENIVRGFAEWTSLNCDSYSFVSKQNKKLEEKNVILEKENVELEKTNQELEAKQKDLEEEVEELEERVKTEQEQVKHVVETGEKWSKTQAEDIKVKNQKLKSASEKISYLEARVEKLEEESSQKSKKIEKLSKQLSDNESQNESLKSLRYLNSKPLPALPIEEENKASVKQSMFRQLKTKAKVKIQKLQKLIKREIFHNQEMIAQVEVKSK